VPKPNGFWAFVFKRKCIVRETAKPPHASSLVRQLLYPIHIPLVNIPLLIAIAYDKGMGKIEQESRKRTRKKLLQKVILGSVAAAGLLSVALVAPNAIQALAKLGIIDIKKRRGEYINRARNRLVDAGLLSRDKKGFLQLTQKGEARLRELELSEYRLKKPKRWDGKWRMLIFDIPEYRKTLREKVRRTLINIGFIRLQDSVWVYPYPCDDLIALLKTDFRVGRDILYIIADSIENDVALRKQFALS